MICRELNRSQIAKSAKKKKGRGGAGRIGSSYLRGECKDPSTVLSLGHGRAFVSIWLPEQSPAPAFSRLRGKV